MLMHCDKMIQFRGRWFNFFLKDGTSYNCSKEKFELGEEFLFSDLKNRHEKLTEPAIIFFDEET